MSYLGYPAVEERPLAESGGGDFSGSGPFASDRMAYSPFAHPFAGWITLSDMIADSNPELSEAMRALAGILQAAIEQSVAARFTEIRSSLLEVGIPRWSIDDAERALLSGLLPLSAQELVQEAEQAFAELYETGTVESTEPASSGFIASVVHYGGHAILGREEDLDSPPPRLPVRYEDLPEGFLDYFLPATPLRVVASLDLPSVASGQDFSIWCRRTLHRRGDNLLATEHTYIEREIEGLVNPRFQGDSVTSQYRADVENWQPPEFSESIDLGRPLDQYYYIYELTDPKRSRAARRLRRLLERNAPTIRQAIGEASDKGIELGAAAAAAFGLPVGVLAPLVKPAGRMLWSGLISHLETSLADTTMTPWSISHTTLYSSEYPVGPLSMFILLSPAAPTAKLHQIRRDNYDPDVSKMELGYGERKRSYQRGRGMMGLTRPPNRRCPTDLWAQVVGNNQPAAWTEPGHDQAGFRVLVPHAEAGSDARYASALWADVLGPDVGA
jgi:hypothetical protein